MTRWVTLGSNVITALVVMAIGSIAIAANATKVTIVGADGGAATVTAGALNVNAAVTPGGTQDVNLKQVNGGTTSAFNTGTVGAQTTRMTLATDVNVPVGTGSAGTAATGVATVQGIASMVPLVTVATGVFPTTSLTRPNDTNAYAANDAMSNSTSSPTSGGFTVTSACRASGGSGTIVAATMLMSTAASTSLQAEIWIFNQAVTNINDNDAFAVSDGDMANFVGKIPFTTSDGASNNASATVLGINLPFTCTGTANLRYIVKVINAYTPAAQEVLTFNPKIIYN